MNNQSFIITPDSYLKICLLTLFSALVIMAPDAAYAVGDDTTIADTLCNVVSFFTGRIGKGIATLAIIVVGVGALMGKVSWGMAIIVALGVAVIFGASAIVEAISNANDSGGC